MNGVPIEEMYAVWERAQRQEAEAQRQEAEARLRKMEAARRARAKYREAHKDEHRLQNQEYYARHRVNILERRKLSASAQ